MADPDDARRLRAADERPDEGLVDDDLERRFEAELDEFLEPHGRAARAGTTGWRPRLRRTRGGAVALKAGVFLLGLVFVGIGAAAVVLPGPLTIPPVLLGLWIWASEFEWADSLFQRARQSGVDAWEQAKRRPVLSAVTTVGGLVAVGAVVWAAGHYGWVDTAKGWVGL